MRFMVLGLEDAIAKNDKPYIKVQAVTEEKTRVMVFVWENLNEFKDLFEKTPFMDISVNLEDQFPKVLSFRPVEGKKHEFMDSAFPNDEVADQVLTKLMDSIQNPTYRALNEKLFMGEVRQKFITSSAAHGQHHVIRNGLLKHTLEVMQFVSAICKSEYGAFLDKERVLEGALCHDIGKVWEYTIEDCMFDYTAAFYTSSHLSTGAEMVARLADVNDPDIQHLMHVIRSHHLLVEWGAVCKPATPEAFVVFYGDHFSMVKDKFSSAKFSDSGLGSIPKVKEVFVDFDKLFPKQ